MPHEDQVRDLIQQVRHALLDQAQVRTGLRPAHAKALTFILVGGLLLSFLLFFQSKPREVEVAVAPDSVSMDPLKPQPVAEVVVDVAGKVAKPGVYRLAQGSRAIDALQAAGGALPGVSTESINLAHVLVDGEQLLIGTMPPGSQSSLVNINSASAEELDRLPGVGPVLAQRIISFRQSHGRFRSIEEIKKVPGVGAATFADLKTLIRV